MKDRRVFVVFVSLILLSIFASGCVSMESGEFSIDYKNISTSIPLTPSTLSLGENAIHNGIEVSVEDYRTGKDLSINHRDEQPSAGAVFVAVKLRVKNVGEVEKEIPSSYVWEIKGSNLEEAQFEHHSDIKLEYKGQKVGMLIPSTFGIPVELKDFILEGESYRSYERGKEIEEKLHAYPGVERSGWLLYELPKNFDPHEARFKIEAGGKTHVWSLSLKEVSIKEIKQNPEKYSNMSFSVAGIIKEVTVGKTEQGRKIKYIISDESGYNKTISPRSILDFRRDIDLSEDVGQEYVVEGHLERFDDGYILVLERVEAGSK